MEKSVAIRFYEVDRPRQDLPLFIDVLQTIANLPVVDRARRITGEQFIVRLEDYNVHNGNYEGQFVRGQSANRPGRMTIDRTVELPFDDPVGHGIAFLYRPNDGLLAIEYNPITLSPSRALSYLSEHCPHAEFKLTPKARAGVWQEIDRKPLRKLSISIAGSPDVEINDDPNQATWENIADMRDRYGAQSIKIEIGMGRTKGGLTDGAKRFLRDAFMRHTDGSDDIRAIKGTVENDEGVPNEEINLIDTYLNHRETLEFREGNWDDFYIARRDLLRRMATQVI